MKATTNFTLGLVAILFVTWSVSQGFRTGYQDDNCDKGTARVEQVQGMYIFAKSRPVCEYEHIGVVNAPFVGKHEFDKLVESMIKDAKRDFPLANAIIFDGPILQSHNTKASAVRLK